jgi:outer membrane protein TolC
MRRIAILLMAFATCAALAQTPPAQEAIPTLTLDDAIRLALQRNKNLKVSSYLPGIARANLLVARGAFDPSLVAERLYQSSQFNDSVGPIPINDLTKIDTYSAGVQGLLPVGTLYQITASTIETRDVYNGITQNYQTFGGFSVTQPLLKGFGLAANLEQVRIQKANRSISDLTYQLSAINTVTNVIVDYSNLQLAHDQLESAQAENALANRQVRENEEKYKAGSTSQSDVLEMRAYASEFVEQILIAERAVRDAQNALRELIGEETFFEEEPLFVLAPMPIPEVTVDRRSDVQRALLMRPDYQIARFGIVQDRAVEAAARNRLLPQVDFQGGYGYNGSAMSFSASKQMVEDRMNPSVSAGLVVTVPLTFAVGRGTLRAAKLTREQAEESLSSMAADIAVAVAAADGQVETSRKRVAADQTEVSLAKQALEAEEKKNKAGTGSTISVIQQQQILATAESAVSYALAAERQAVAVYDQTLGTTLERYHVKLTDEWSVDARLPSETASH